MPFYHQINNLDADQRTRTLERLTDLRAGLDSIPEKTMDSTLLLATWNIRDFDKPAYGDRLEESIYYIAEVISRFDIVAIQEVYKDLKGLKRVMKVLGGYWKYIVTDVSGGSRGNKERMTFVYDSRKVRFGGLAGEMVLPQVKLANDEMVPAEQIWRSPYICGFSAGWSRFMLATVHILWGGGGAEPANRVEEIEKVAKFLRNRTDDKTAWSKNLILLGDFNIFSVEDKTFKVLTDQGFQVPDALQQFTTNAGRNRQYDQIAFRIHKDRLDWTENSGVFDFFDHVFREEDQETYIPEMGQAYTTKRNGGPRTAAQKRTYYKTHWRTHQMSDHLPLWVELKIDFSDRYLEKLQES